MAEDVLLGDAYDVPDDGVEVDAKTGELRAHRDDDETTDAERVALAKARATTTGAASAHRVFVDVVKTDASDACEPTATVVVEFHAHDEDSTTNAARALEWFDNACETRTSGQSYVGAGVRVIENGKILQHRSTHRVRGDDEDEEGDDDPRGDAEGRVVGRRRGARFPRRERGEFGGA